MSKFKKIIQSVTSLLGLSAPKAPEINIPKAQIPAVPAPTPRTDTGAAVAVGTSADVKNQRVSGRSSGSSNRTTVDILGGLGRGGLNI